MHLLLDTNVVVWLLLGDRRSVSDKAQQTLADDSNAISVSAVSVWEIAIKRSLASFRSKTAGRELLPDLTSIHFQ